MFQSTTQMSINLVMISFSTEILSLVNNYRKLSRIYFFDKYFKEVTNWRNDFADLSRIMIICFSFIYFYFYYDS